MSYTVQIKHRFTGAALYSHEATDEQHARGIATRVALQAATAAKVFLRDADLGGAYLRGADLRGADLRGAYLRDAYLGGAYLRGADLGGAYLRDAYLGGAYLRGADLRGADLGGADLRDADLGGADLRGADLGGADLRGADLGGAGPASPEQSIENLDRVRAIILDNKARLEMGHWHQTEEWRDRTCAEETLCETTHCLAGWLHVCSTDDKVREMKDPQIAGIVSAPIAAKMFFRAGDEVLSWLDERKYVAEIAEREAAKKARQADKLGAA